MSITSWVYLDEAEAALRKGGDTQSLAPLGVAEAVGGPSSSSSSFIGGVPAGIAPVSPAVGETVASPGGDGSPEYEMDQVGDEAAAVVRHSTPRTPTAAEIDEHEVLGHSVYRSWCPICVRSRGIDNAHHPAPKDREAAVPTISVDYCYAGQRDEEGMPMLVAKDSSTKMLWGTSVPEKGVNEFVVS